MPIEAYPHIRQGKVENHFEKTILSIPNQDSNLDLFIIASLFYRESSSLSHESTEAGDTGIRDMDTTIDTALEAGFRHIDTAYAYKNEEAIGKSLKRWFDSGKIKREELFIVTKLPSSGNRAEDVENYLKQSLENLQMTYVDLYLIHQPIGSFPEPDKDGNRVLNPNTDHLSLWKAMEAQVDAGRARSIGLSNFNARQVKRVWENARIKPANNQVELNLFFQQKELVAFCKALDVTICAYSPLGSPGMCIKMHKGDPSNVLNVLFYSMKAATQDIDTTIDTALEAGFRHIDTAYGYKNEEAIGKSLKRWFDSGKIKREELFIVTKLPSTGNRAEDVEKYLKQSLKNLQMTYVDLYLIHKPIGYFPELDKDGNHVPDPSTDHLSIWKAMEAQVDAGRARSIGMSNFNARQVKRVWENARIKPANNQVELNLFFQQKELVAFCKALDVTICAYSPLGSPGMRIKMHKGDPSKVEMPLTNPVVLKLAKKYNKTPSQILIRHSIQRGVVVIPKSNNPERLKQNIQVFDFTLSPEDAMEAQVDAGRARSIGLSNFNARQVKRVWENARIKPANNQVELNAFFQRKELVAFCKALDMPLTDPVVLKLAKKYNKTPSQILIRHSIQRGVVVIPKSNNPERLKQNIQLMFHKLEYAMQHRFLFVIKCVFDDVYICNKEI
uniref:NADP-dependent oxidoreductase domain-containing protein n=1 Tax=Timema douglasi TaxID=61478 RepID=A0A7R8Z980_TIMDO|nr:unnamed protein product [Timema douglasi]